MDAAATFRSAVSDLEAGMDQLRKARREIVLDNQRPPRKLAPYAAAIGAIVHEPVPGHRGGGSAHPAAGDDADTEIGWGSFVLLYDPAGQTGWAGPFRVIAYIRAELDPEIAADPLIGQVGWSWLTEALDTRTNGYRQVSGTVTRVVTEGFGAKQDQPVTTEFELRASWSPAARAAAGPVTRPGITQPDGAPQDLDGHIAAWCDALCAACGLPPLPAGVSALRPPRSRRRP
jgi:Protein of unknown function (DUF3000)